MGQPLTLEGVGNGGSGLFQQAGPLSEPLHKWFGVQVALATGEEIPHPGGTIQLILSTTCGS
jgi:hypothetical protein